jgi:thioredoxin reductase (NADPH)
MQDRLFANPKVRVIWNAAVEEILGEGNPPHVTGLKLRDTVTGAVNQLAVDGFFVAIGHTPVTDIFRDQITLDADGYIVTRPDSTATNVPGVFAAGDVKDKVYRQAVTAAGMGCMAALEAEKFIAAHESHGTQSQEAKGKTARHAAE